MRDLGPVAAALLTLLAAASLAGCATGLPVRESGVELTDTPPPGPRPPREGLAESATSRDIGVVFSVADKNIELRAWCRVGVWTTLQQFDAKAFVARESWGRLGARKPRRLARIRDEVLGGVLARLKPTADGGLSFLLEVAEAGVAGRQAAGEFSGERIELGRARRHGYRFSGHAPEGWTGALAAWGDAVRVLLAPAAQDPANAGGERGFVVGNDASAEYFVEEWIPREPVRTDADGVARADFSLRRRRSASGFKPDGKGWYKTYGATFELSAADGVVRFRAGR